jgi:hypothetical protein
MSVVKFEIISPIADVEVIATGQGIHDSPG